MKIIIGTLAALLFGTVLVSSEAEARCWWNGYNHCRYYHHGWHNGLVSSRVLVSLSRLALALEPVIRGTKLQGQEEMDLGERVVDALKQGRASPIPQAGVKDKPANRKSCPKPVGISDGKFGRPGGAAVSPCA